MPIAQKNTLRAFSKSKFGTWMWITFVAFIEGLNIVACVAYEMRALKINPLAAQCILEVHMPQDVKETTKSFNLEIKPLSPVPREGIRIKLSQAEWPGLVTLHESCFLHGSGVPTTVAYQVRQPLGKDTTLRIQLESQGSVIFRDRNVKPTASGQIEMQDRITLTSLIRSRANAEPIGPLPPGPEPPPPNPPDPAEFRLTGPESVVAGESFKIGIESKNIPVELTATLTLQPENVRGLQFSGDLAKTVAEGVSWREVTIKGQTLERRRVSFTAEVSSGLKNVKPIDPLTVVIEQSVTSPETAKVNLILLDSQRLEEHSGICDRLRQYAREHSESLYAGDMIVLGKDNPAVLSGDQTTFPGTSAFSYTKSDAAFSRVAEFLGNTQSRLPTIVIWFSHYPVDKKISHPLPGNLDVRVLLIDGPEERDDGLKEWLGTESVTFLLPEPELIVDFIEDFIKPR